MGVDREPKYSEEGARKALEELSLFALREKQEMLLEKIKEFLETPSPRLNPGEENNIAKQMIELNEWARSFSANDFLIWYPKLMSSCTPEHAIRQMLEELPILQSTLRKTLTEREGSNPKNKRALRREAMQNIESTASLSINTEEFRSLNPAAAKRWQLILESSREFFNLRLKSKKLEELKLELNKASNLLENHKYTEFTASLKTAEDTLSGCLQEKTINEKLNDNLLAMKDSQSPTNSEARIARVSVEGREYRLFAAIERYLNKFLDYKKLFSKCKSVHERMLYFVDLIRIGKILRVLKDSIRSLRELIQESRFDLKKNIFSIQGPMLAVEVKDRKPSGLDIVKDSVRSAISKKIRTPQMDTN